jgi:hypothetical protein
VGTGTMLSGLNQQRKRLSAVIGISVLKNNFSLHKEIQKLLHPKKPFSCCTIFILAVMPNTHRPFCSL